MSTISGGKVFEPLLFDQWDPLKSFNTFSDNAIYAPGSNFVTEVLTFANPCFDWKETLEAHIVEADLPDVKKEDVKVEVVEGGALQISGEWKREQEEKTHRWLLHERGNGKFLRRFPLPENVKVDQAKASMKNGVLSVIVPKEEVKKPYVKSIEIS
ncbi:18.1 kDa class I heat shock protein-like [Dendrobium catenatum]|uniref:17.7 kDa class I heat shock protein n=1 Tax=Dendrobium catenatum TaxID=906689 RepID=A0A2I0WJC4_9ASPA|nr:18.1 kDa class I heat shock protein-like [Dendrobium catenatum]PKU75764.1 17.7 kDa class I heat shock protein [Dendrobium catenatum]